MDLREKIGETNRQDATIAQWIRLRTSMMPPQVRLQSPLSTLEYFIVKFVLYLSLHCEKNENKQKDVGFGPLKT